MVVKYVSSREVKATDFLGQVRAVSQGVFQRKPKSAQLSTISKFDDEINIFLGSFSAESVLNNILAPIFMETVLAVKHNSKPET